MCQHSEHKIINVSSPDADGIDECFKYEARCKECDKLLVTRYECISANWCDIHDKEWGEQNKDLLID